MFEALRGAYLSYYETAFRLRDRGLVEQRRALLDADGGMWREPHIEMLAEYEAGDGTLSDILEKEGIAPEVSSDFLTFAQCGLFTYDKPYSHQAEALSAALSGKDVAIKAGTGSGKTEAFLMPIVADLIRQSADWNPSPEFPAPWWEVAEGAQPKWRAMRPIRTGKDQREHNGVRALILYPMNALATDQLQRLRVGLGSAEALSWLDSHRGGNRFYFGRYTGQADLTGRPEDDGGKQDQRKLVPLRREYEMLARRIASLEAAGATDQLHYLPDIRPGSPEMNTRWDMNAIPPDILLTNYSMLSTMLVRPIESDIWKTTRDWLDQGPPEDRFTLVLDEAHMYRNAQATEVSLLIRSLIHRLGLTDAPERVRFFAASASLEENRDESFVKDFFGRPEGSFQFISDSKIDHSASESGALPLLTDDSAGLIKAAADKLRTDRSSVSTEDLVELSSAHDLVSRVETAFQFNAADETKVRSLSAVRNSFTELSGGDEETLDGSLTIGVELTRRGARPHGLRVRNHLFFSKVDGLWACSNRQCGSGDQGNTDPRTSNIGRLFSTPLLRCSDCGSRVLEVLYCDDCGEHLLGGYFDESNPVAQVHALRSEPFLDSGASHGFLSDVRAASNYKVIYPQRVEPTSSKNTRTQTKNSGERGITQTWSQCEFNPLTGTAAEMIRKSANPVWVLNVTNNNFPDASALPWECPRCTSVTGIANNADLEDRDSSRIRLLEPDSPRLRA